MISRIKKYFDYNDRLRRTVSIITGVLIVIFNFYSGFMLVNILSAAFLGIKDPSNIILLLYIIPGITAGAVLLKFSVDAIDLMLGKVEIEKYSYLRMVLLISIAEYFVILLIFILTALSASIQKMFLN